MKSNPRSNDIVSHDDDDHTFEVVDENFDDDDDDLFDDDELWLKLPSTQDMIKKRIKPQQSLF